MLVAEPDSGFRYWAFISYSHRDQSWARWLHRALETYRVPARLVGQPIEAGSIPARLTPIFRDRDELPTSADLDRSVAEALRQSWSLIVICSPHAAESRWVNEEVREFQRLGRAARIHCLVVSDGAAPCFPPALRERPWGDAGAGEPIAADARHHGDGKTNARLKLVAGILGISFDKLVQRDHQRGYRRMAAIAAAAVLGFALLAVFTVITITSRREAEAQRSHAEGLVEFMLGDLRKKLEPDGRLATLDAVGNEALAYYAAQDPASLDADALARRARALHLIGEVYDQRGRIDDALGVFKQAASSTDELLARDKDNPQRIFDHAQSVYWVGLIAWRRGQRDEAEVSFRDYKALADRLLRTDPVNPDWRVEVEYADENLGTLLLEKGLPDQAAELFERSLRTALDLAQAKPSDAARAFDVAQLHAWLADARLDQGRLQDAVGEREAEVAIYQDLLATDQKNNDARSGMLVAERELGRLAAMRGNLSLALSQLKRASELARDLLASSPDSTTLQQQSSAAYADLSLALIDAGEGGASRAAVLRARELARKLVERDPSVVAWQLRFSRSLLIKARLDAGTDPLGALREIEGVLRRLEGLRQKGAIDQQTRLLYGMGLRLAADRNAALGNAQAASEQWQQLLMLVQDRNAPLKGPRGDALALAALSGLERKADAAEMAARLQQVGFHDF